MKPINLKAMSLDALIDLRDRADRLIRKRAVTEKRSLEEQLARLSGFVGRLIPGRRRSLKGRKIAPKYANPANRSETWAGRGVRPRWLRALLKEGRQLEEFAISKATASRAKTVARKGRRKLRRRKAKSAA